VQLPPTMVGARLRWGEGRGSRTFRNIPGQGDPQLVGVEEEKEAAPWSDEATEDQRKELISNHNAMVDAMQAAAERFNAELAKHRAQEKLPSHADSCTSDSAVHRHPGGDDRHPLPGAGCPLERPGRDCVGRSGRGHPHP